jgi:hypothetical protein
VKVGEVGVSNRPSTYAGLIGVRLEDNERCGPTGESIAVAMAALMATAVLSAARVAAADGGHHHKDERLKFDAFTEPKRKWDDDKKVGTIKQEKNDGPRFDLDAALQENKKYHAVFGFKV